MNKKKRNFVISGVLILVAVIFTILVQVVDVKTIGVNGTSIGFATINQFVFETVGVNMIWYHITDWLGIVPILMAMVYALIGFIQLIKRRSLLKVDKEIILLGMYYIVVIGMYVLFEKYVINYRPILMYGFLEASYPSSHTLMTICLCGSSILINNKIFKNKATKIVNAFSVLIIIITVIGRLISGVHWFSDIVGGIIISTALLMTFYSLLNIVKKD